MKIAYLEGQNIGDKDRQQLSEVKETLKKRIQRRADKINYKHSQHAIKTFKPVIKN